jgi:hypothetical protein
VQLECIVTKLLCIKFFESLLHNIEIANWKLPKGRFKSVGVPEKSGMNVLR